MLRAWTHLNEDLTPLPIISTCAKSDLLPSPKSDSFIALAICRMARTKRREKRRRR